MVFSQRRSRAAWGLIVVAGFLSCAPQAEARQKTPRPLNVGMAIRQIFGTTGYPSNVLTKGSSVIVSISPFSPSGEAGIEVFGANSSTGRFDRSCEHLLTFPAADKVTSVMGMKFLNKRQTRLGAAVECAGAEIASLGNPASCAFQATPIRVPQPSVENCQGNVPPGTFDLAVAPGAQYAFLANEYGTLAGMPPDQGGGGTVGVIPLLNAGNPGYSVYVPGGNTIAGVTVSRDGKRLYVTTEGATTIRRCGTSLSESCNNPTKLIGSELVKESGCHQKHLSGAGVANGLLTVFDVAKLKKGMAQNAIINTIAAGCSPVRIVESRDGRTIWVAARGDDNLLTFDVGKLVSQDVGTVNASFLGSTASAGTAPVGMALFSKNRLLAVVNSNRFNYPGGTSSLVIFDVRERLPRQLATLNIPPMVVVPLTINHPDIADAVDGFISTFPRNVEVGADDATLYVTKFVAGEVMVVDTTVTPAQ